MEREQRKYLVAFSRGYVFSLSHFTSKSKIWRLVTQPPTPLRDDAAGAPACFEMASAHSLDVRNEAIVELRLMSRIALAACSFLMRVQACVICRRLIKAEGIFVTRGRLRSGALIVQRYVRVPREHVNCTSVNNYVV